MDLDPKSWNYGILKIQFILPNYFLNYKQMLEKRSVKS